MAVLPMKKLHLIAMKQDQKQILSFLQRQEVVELTTVDRKDSVFSPISYDADAIECQAQLETTEKALQILNHYAPPESTGLAMLHGRESKTIKEYEDITQRRMEVYKGAEHITHLEALLAENHGNIVRLTAGQSELAPWMTVPVPLSFSGTKSSAAFIGALSGEVALSDLQVRLAEVTPDLPAIHIEILNTSKEQTNILALTLRENRDQLKEALDSIGFKYPSHRMDEVPAAAFKRLEAEKERLRKHCEELKGEIKGHATARPDLQFLRDYYAIEKESHEAGSSLSQSRHTFLLEGYVLGEREEMLQSQLAKMTDCIVDFSPVPADAENIPVELRNSWFSEPCEPILESYGYPSPGELDPTSVMSFFYYLLFGMMFSDAGYGLILATACAIVLIKFKNIEPDFNKSVRMFFWCGISTIFWGIIFSSYFGDIVDVVSSHFFNRPLTIPPVWFSPLDKPMLLLMFSLALGVIHLSVGYLLKMKNCVSDKDTVGVVFDCGGPLLFIVGAILLFMNSTMFENMVNFRIYLPPWGVTMALVLCAAGCLGVLFFGGRESRNWGKRLLKGIYELYNMLAGWLSDILSYSRLLALGIATGVIGSVVNQLAAMAGSGIANVIAFILIIVLGHALNFGLNILGAYVHSNRLEYVEFFGKFYDGGSKRFAPFKINTKHYKIREDMTNE